MSLRLIWQFLIMFRIHTIRIAFINFLFIIITVRLAVIIRFFIRNLIVKILFPICFNVNMTLLLPEARYFRIYKRRFKILVLYIGHIVDNTLWGTFELVKIEFNLIGIVFLSETRFVYREILITFLSDTTEFYFLFVDFFVAGSVLA